MTFYFYYLQKFKNAFKPTKNWGPVDHEISK